MLSILVGGCYRVRFDLYEEIGAHEPRDDDSMDAGRLPFSHLERIGG